MQSGRYYFAIIFFLAFLTVLIIFTLPIKVGNATISSYFSIPPNEELHYTHVTDGTNTTAFVRIDNTLPDAYDLTNISFKLKVQADNTLSGDTTLEIKTWDNNLTVLRGEIKTLYVHFNATYPYPTTRSIYISITWGFDAPDEKEARIAELIVGSDFVLESFFNLHNTVILTMSIAMGITLLIILFAAIKDFKRFKRRRLQPTPPPSSPQALLPDSIPPSTRTPSLIPPSTVTAPPSARRAEPMPTMSIELIPCPKCGSKIDKTQIICSNCGYELPKCAICNLVIDDDDAIETCPECGTIGHRTHFREWVHVKGSCPICKKNISFD